MKTAPIVLLILLLAGGCDRRGKAPAVDPTSEGSPDSVASTEPPVDAGPDSTTNATMEPGVRYSGDPIGVSEVVVLNESGGFRVERQRWKVPQAEGTAWRVRVPLDADVSVLATDEVEPFAAFLPEDDGPWAAINGGFYEADGEEGFRAMGLVISQGETVSKLTRRGGSGVFYVDDEGPAIVHRDAFDAAPAAAIQSIDRIVVDGESVVNPRPERDGAARSAVVVGADFLWLVIAVSEADILSNAHGATLRKTRTGLTLSEFADYIRQTTDVRHALNLDGGVSTQLAARQGDFSIRIDGVKGTMNSIVLRPNETGKRRPASP